MTNTLNPGAVEAVALKPSETCPFCGSADIEPGFGGLSFVTYWQRCRSCGAHGPQVANRYTAKADAVAAWDRRAIPTPPPADHTDLIALLREYAVAFGISIGPHVEANLERAADALQAHASPRELRLEAALRVIVALEPDILWDIPDRDTGDRPCIEALDVDEVRSIARTALEQG